MKEIVNMIVSFIGVLIVVTFSTRSAVQTNQNTDFLMFIVAIIANIASCFGLAVVNVAIRSLKGVHFSVTAGV